MRKSIALLGLLVVSLVSLGSTGCATREVVVVREGRPSRAACAGGVWVEGHRGPRGRWWPGHWRCPGVVEVVEVE